jgi:prepilin-type N-terminal cleavage/methylation domain-containing protein
MRLRSGGERRGLTLLEVIISLAVFLFSLAAIAHLLSISGDQTVLASWRSQAVLRCQSKLAEVVAGAQPMSSSGWSSFSDDPEWSWQANCTQGSTSNLWTVQVSVRRKRPGGTTVEVSLSQMVIAPTARGSTLVSPITNNPNSSSTSGNQNDPNSSGGNTSGSSPSTPTPAAGGAPGKGGPGGGTRGGGTGGGGGGGGGAGGGGTRGGGTGGGGTGGGTKGGGSSSTGKGGG